MIQRIEEIIEEQNLREKTKYRYLVHRRWFLFRLLRKNGVVLQRIGEMFNLNHATIIYGLKMSEFYEEKKDEIYRLDTLNLQEEFGNVEIILKQRNLVEDIKKCNSTKQLLVIKARLKNSQYKNFNNRV